MPIGIYTKTIGKTIQLYQKHPLNIKNTHKPLPCKKKTPSKTGDAPSPYQENTPGTT